MQTQNFEFTNKEQVFYNKYIGNFATPKRLNRSNKKLPAALEKLTTTAPAKQTVLF